MKAQIVYTIESYFVWREDTSYDSTYGMSKSADIIPRCNYYNLTTMLRLKGLNENNLRPFNPAVLPKHELSPIDIESLREGLIHGISMVDFVSKTASETEKLMYAQKRARFMHVLTVLSEFNHVTLTKA